MTQAQERKPRWGVIVTFALIGSIAAIIVLGQVKIDGVPLIESPSTIIVQIVASSALVLAAAIPLLRRAERNSASAATDAAAARDQVTNAHTTNLREESDDRHDELTTLVRKVLSEQKQQGKDIARVEGTVRGAQRDIGRVSNMTVSISNRQNALSERQGQLDERFHRAVEALETRETSVTRAKLRAIIAELSAETEGDSHG